MFKNYLKVALRNLWGYKTYSSINIFGLAIGIACCILIFLYVQHELQHDRFHENAHDIFRIMIQENAANGERKLTTLFPTSFAEAVKKELPAVKRATSYIASRTRITHENRSFDAQCGLVNTDFLQMFLFPLLAGDPASVLSQPNNLVISKSLADKIFGASPKDYAEIRGKILNLPYTRDKDFVVTGVMRDVPNTSSLQFEFLIPLMEETHQYFWVDMDWGGEATVYLQLAEGWNVKALEAALPPFMEKHLGPQVERSGRTDLTNRNIREVFQLRLQPLTDIYLNSEVGSHYTARGNAFYSYILAGIALIVLLIACINFMTLSIGRSVSRVKEVGVRKVLGAQRQQLMRQFWGEALLLTLLAAVLGIGLAELFLPVFNYLADRELFISYFGNLQAILVLLGIIAVTGLLAGSYPAAVLSHFHPVTVFQGRVGITGRQRFTRGLVVVQYALAIAFMIGTGVMLQQLHYMREKALGYDKEQLAVVSLTGEEEISERLKNKLSQYPQVISTAASDRSFTSGWQSRGIKKDDGEWETVRIIRIDSDYLQTLGIDLIVGRNFSETFATDTMQSVIVNETLVKTFGWQNPIGERLQGLATREGQQPPAIVGVVKDFHIDALRYAIQPLVLTISPDYGGLHHLFVRIRPDDIPGTITLLREAWKTVVPDEPFQFSFLDENLNRQYRNEERWSRIVAYAAIFAIVISCMGLLGLASLAVNRRTKEIGIRKVFGASIKNIVALLSKDFARLMILADLIAWPVAYYVVNRWLENFAYRSPDLVGARGWWVFALAGGLALVIALLTVGTQAIKAALANPVEALRYE
jgi:putative ABC transport system permease protein